jgi:hypothetical protein
MLLLCVFAACALAVSCKDEQGDAVDWFVAMKIPASTCTRFLCGSLQRRKR